MNITFRLPFAIVRTDVADSIKKAEADALKAIKAEKNAFEEQVRKASHNAYAGIVCDVCKLNVYRGEGTWVHGNGGKAYCLDPCWKGLHKK